MFWNQCLSDYKMKTRLLIILAIGISGLVIPSAFSVTEELMYGSSSIELLPDEIISGKPTLFEIKFQYTEGPYALDNFIPVIEVSPDSARSYVTIDVDPREVTNRQVVRIPVTLTVDPQIEHEKIFLSISFSGDHFSSRSDAIYKSSWSESVILNISSEKLSSIELPSSQDYEFETMSGARCDGEISLCYGTFANGTSVPIQCDYRHSCGVVSFDDYDVFYQSPLKQFKSGIIFDDLKCKTGLESTIKVNDFKRFYCVSLDTKQILLERGWAFDESKACRNPMDCFDSGISLDKTIYPVPKPMAVPDSDLKLISKSFAIFYVAERRDWTEEDFTTFNSHAILLKIKNDGFAFEIDQETLEEKGLPMNRFNQYDEGQYIWLVYLTENKEYEYHIDAITGKILLEARDGSVLEN